MVNMFQAMSSHGQQDWKNQLWGSCSVNRDYYKYRKTRKEEAVRSRIGHSKLGRMKLGIVDLLVFALSLAIPLFIAVYFSCVKKQRSTTDYLMANRNMNFIPVGFSMCASYLSAIIIIGFPAEIFYNGWLFPFTSVFPMTISALGIGNLFISEYYKMKLTSVYEYLGIRYESLVTRVLGSLNYSVGMLLFMGVVLYAPCLMLQTLTGFPIYILICAIGLTTTIYTAVGGLKTVIWTDLFQCIMMLSILIAIIIKGTEVAGGPDRIWEIGLHTGRVEWANWNPSPFVRNTSIWIFAGQLVHWGAIFATHQTQVQRYCASKSLPQARWALLLSVGLIWVFMACTVLSGLVILGVYWACDPLSAGLISRKDELVGLFVQDHLAAYSGITGLFAASLMSGALSTLSSGFNSLASVIWRDLFVAFDLVGSASESNAAKQLFITKAIATIMGLISIMIALAAPSLPAVLQLATTFIMVLGGPLLATFTLGFFSRFSNKFGASCGILVGDAAALWMVMGAFVWKPLSVTRSLPSFNLGCNMSVDETMLLEVNETMVNIGMDGDDEPFYIPEGDWQTIFYSTSFNLYGPFGFIISFIVNVVVSLAVRMVQRKVKSSDHCHELSSVANSPDKANLHQMNPLSSRIGL